MAYLSKKLSIHLIVIGILSAPLALQAAPEVQLSISAEKEVQVTDANGQAHTERQPAADAAPGDTLIYTLRYRNSGDEAARNVKLDNPIAEGNSYIGDSAWGDGADIQFSIDGGQTFKKPAALTWAGSDGKGGKETRKATPEQYNAIRWVIGEIAPNTAGEAGFKARVK